VCGYDAPGDGCPHCGLSASDPSLVPVRGRTGGFGQGFSAVPRGIAILTTTRGTKRWLVPPVLLTCAFYLGALIWAWTWVDRLLDATRAKSIDELDLRQGWLRDALAWLIRQDFTLWIAKTGGFVLLIVVAALVALWTFSSIYALIASPFLDVVQGRVEARWFGRDPTAPPSHADDMSSAKRTKILCASGAASLLAIAAWWWDEAPRAWWWLCAAPGSFALAAWLARDFRIWLAHEIRSQLRALVPGIKASVLTSVVLLVFLWVKFIPVVGYFLFAGLAGFSSAIGLLDIPFSRRRFDFRQRLRFVVQHAPAVFAFGLASSLLFMLPILGPLIGVPAASIGGLWLLCRLDKAGLRPPDAGSPGEKERTRAEPKLAAGAHHSR
jgi:uncharacterized protein involved in cysteine biosynthesis